MNRITKTNRKIKNSLYFLLAAMMILMTTGFTASGQHEFITTWQATGNSITVPTTGGGYNYNIYWEEIGNEVNNNGNATATGNYTINTTNANQYRVKITGQFPRIYFNDGGDKNKILTVEQWGDIAWTSMSEAFSGCSNLTVPAADAPDLPGVLSLQNMFKNATLLTVDHIDLWDVSHIENMSGVFINCLSFNGNIGNWDVSHVTNMMNMFSGATSFNQDIANWDVSNVTNMIFMFLKAASFDQHIGNWNVGNVTNMSGMFLFATAFNQDIGNWDVTQVSNMTSMLSESGLSSTNYNLTLAGWASKNVKANVRLDADGLKYCSETARNTLISTKGWMILGDAEECFPFITTWQATGNSITVPTTGGGYNYNIYWEEIGNEVNNNGNATATGNYTINTTNANQYRVKITGQFPRIYFNDGGDKNKILTVNQWGDIAWTSMSEAFFGCSNLTVPAADAPDLSGVLSLQNMFKNCTLLTVDHIDLWDVSHVQYMDGLFVSCTSFNGNIGGWNVGSAIGMSWMFENATAFNQNIGSWDMSNVVSTFAMFNQASQFNKDIGNWNVSNVTNMDIMFRNATSFNQNISNWNVGNVTSMVEMFMDATAFNQNIGSWDVSNVTAMNGMFRNATSFNQDIGNWNVGNVINMGVMFWNATAFNQNIGSWDVGNVINMGGMFWDASAFNQDISNWNVSNATGMNAMFQNAAAFNHNLGNWDVTKVITMDGMLNNSGLSKENYSLTLAGWASKNVKTNVTLGAQGLEYDRDDAGRETLLLSKSWNIIDDICTDCSFITTWQATGNSITIPTTGGGYNYNIYWEEIGNEVNNNGNATATGNYTINTTNANQYRVKITGQFPRIHFNDGSDKNKILTVEQWGDITWTDMTNAFFGCINLTVPAADAPDLSGVLSLQNMFKNATLLTVDHIDLWDVSHVQYMDGMFVSCTSFNDNIGGWNVSNVKRFRWMFENATAFNQDIGSWDMSNAVSTYAMFYQASQFNQDIGNWNVSNVTDMNVMFRNATSFNQNIGNWNVGNVTSMVEMFMNATAFNQNIGSWDVSNVTAMNGMFRNATSFNQDIGNWNVDNVINMGVMFWNATAFNQNIGSWDVGNVINMGGMFWDASAFNQDISNWNVSNVTGMNVMFQNATAFNHNLGNWNVTKVTTMDGMFNNSPLSRENYELTLAGWASKNVLNNVTLGASGLKYCNETDRNTLISTKNWTITGDAKLCSQTITFNALPAQVYGDIFTLSATASSGLPITYSSSDPSIASIVNNTVTVHATGNITITATQSGDANNEAANSEQQSLTINPKPVTVTATSGQTKAYGEADPAFTYSVNQPLINGDVFSGSLGRTVGENVGTYSINQHTLTAGSNYTITFVGDDFEIVPKTITVTATSGQHKTYGEADPVFTYSSNPALASGDVFSGSLARIAGENVGTYAIHQNTLTAGNNYVIQFVSADFHILKLDQIITFEPIPDKTVGEDPFTVVATASSALPLSFTSSDETVVVISGDLLTIVGAGDVTITAIQSGGDIYNPQESTYTFTVHATSLFIPTLFSPDGNGVNDLFLVRGADIEAIQFVVFDMLGNEVYRTTDVDTATQKGWDGTKGGVNQPAGAYLWSLKGKLRNGNTLLFQGKSSGQVVLMR